VAGLVGAPKHAIYAASKHAVVGLTKSAAAEYGRKGIRINDVCPGVIRTSMLDRALERDVGSEEQMVRMHPIGRLGEIDDVASAVRWLCSDASAFVTGHSLAVDGAMTAVGGARLDRAATLPARLAAPGRGEQDLLARVGVGLVPRQDLVELAPAAQAHLVVVEAAVAHAGRRGQVGGRARRRREGQDGVVAHGVAPRSARCRRTARECGGWSPQRCCAPRKRRGKEAVTVVPPAPRPMRIVRLPAGAVERFFRPREGAA
jgi:hypothetical protein